MGLLTLTSGFYRGPPAGTALAGGGAGTSGPREKNGQQLTVCSRATAARTLLSAPRLPRGGRTRGSSTWRPRREASTAPEVGVRRIAKVINKYDKRRSAIEKEREPREPKRTGRVANQEAAETFCPTAARLARLCPKCRFSYPC
jgi:hypothetical protein